MAGLRPLFAIIVLASALHVLGIARSALPAQDGLKFLRIARAFQTQPWSDVVRSSDQHPLYPALVAVIEPVVSLVVRRGPDAWRVAAQLVSALAAVALLIPLHGLTKTLFNSRIADLAVLGFVLLPLPMAVGHDTLSDPLALCAFVTALRLGVSAPQNGGWRSAIACGLVAGVGFLARPEVLVVPLAVVVTGGSRVALNLPSLKLAAPRLAALAVVFLAVVGSYALVKGEVSEKLAVRYSVGAEPPKPKAVHKANRWLPPGLDDPRWDFSPKEEPAHPPRRRVREVVGDLAFQWAEMLGWLPVLFTVWGLVRDRYIRAVIAREGTPEDADNSGRHLMAVYLVLFTLILARHELRMGYLSGRHLLTLVIVSLPWAAAGAFVCARGFALKVGLGPTTRRLAALALLATCLSVSCVLQFKPAHPSRWGHWAAGKWLAANASGGESVLDTRGWAAFVSGIPAYDYWHVRQAFSDASLAYVVVGDDELKARSRRAETLRAVLAYAGTPVAGFPELRDGTKVGVWVYRFERPTSWEGLRP